MIMCCCFFFFFKQKTAYEMRISDWSSDVCSSDLQPLVREPCLSVGRRADDLFPRHHRAQARRAVGGQPARDPGGGRGAAAAGGKPGANRAPARNRSEERRVGKESGSTCRYRGCAVHLKNKNQLSTKSTKQH